MEGYKCHWCEYRHGGCPHWDIVPNCKEFRIGGCYSCKYYHGNFWKNRCDFLQKNTKLTTLSIYLYSILAYNS